MVTSGANSRNEQLVHQRKGYTAQATGTSHKLQQIVSCMLNKLPRTITRLSRTCTFRPPSLPTDFSSDRLLVFRSTSIKRVLHPHQISHKTLHHTSRQTSRQCLIQKNKLPRLDPIRNRATWTWLMSTTSSSRVSNARKSSTAYTTTIRFRRHSRRVGLEERRCERE